MVSFAELRGFQPAAFTALARKWQTLGTQLSSRAGEVQTQLTALADWEGNDATAAKTALGDHHRKLTDMSGHIGKIPAVLDNAAKTFAEHNTEIDHLVTAAAGQHCTVSADGRVSYGKDAPEDGRTAADGLQSAIDDEVRKATEADADLAQQLGRLTARAAGFAATADRTAAAAAIPPRGTTPAAVKKWWDGLSPADQESLLFSHGNELGALDGIPVVVRDRANRAELTEETAKLTAQRDQLNANPHRSDDEQHRLDEINADLGGAEDILKRLDTLPSAAQPQAYLIDFDANGKGRAVVAAGNPDTAANVLTYVPGTGARMSKVGGDLDRSDRMLQSAAMAGSPSTAAITWVGYDAPQNIVPEAAENKWADGAKNDLDRFQDGLRATHDGPPSHNTVLGHSYGSTVVGHTARDNGLNADDVIFVGSPGVGVDHASDLHLDGVAANDTGAHVHSSVAEHDIIKASNVAIGGEHGYDPLGPDPTKSDFGGSTFTSDPGTKGPWYELGLSTEAHSQYWDPGSKSLVNIGLVTAGKPTH